VDRDLVCTAQELPRKVLHGFDEERDVAKARSLCAPGPTREAVRTRIDGKREGVRLGPRTVEYVAAVTRPDVCENVAEGGG
jgi:hypothetical protein